MNRKIYVVDAHAHPPRDEGAMQKEGAVPQSMEEIDCRFEQDLETLVCQMDRLHADMKILLAMPSDIEHLFHFGETGAIPGIRSYTTEEWIIKAHRRYPQRFLGVACLNPLEPDSIEHLEYLVKEHGFRGAKMHQAHYNIRTDDERLAPFYNKCIELDIPVAFHTGFPPERGIDHYITSMPHSLDELACSFPELKIIMCHTGGNWYQDGVMIAMRNPNIMVDIAGLPWICERLVSPRVDGKELIRRIIQLLGADRVLFGTDNMDEDMNLCYMEELGLTDHQLQMVMGENAEKLFKIEKGAGL